MYYSCSSFGGSKSAIGVVKSTSLNNPDWQDMGKVVSSSSYGDINAIDPGMFRDDDGKIYMVYGSWHGGIGIVDIDSVTGKATSKVVRLYGGGGMDTEAPALFKKGEYYYLVVNRGTCCDGVNSTYRMLVGRSTSVKGPYTDFKTLLPNKDGKYIGPGHFGLVQGACADYVSIHYYNGNSNGFPTLDILKMRMEDDWPVLYRNFYFNNCEDYMVVDAGSGGKKCVNSAIDLASLGVPPSASFYDSLLWDDNNAGGYFDDANLIHPVYTPPADYVGKITLTLKGIQTSPSKIILDKMVLEFVENDIILDAGSDERMLVGTTFHFSSAITPASAANQNRLLWRDNVGGWISNTKTILPFYRPPEGFTGDISFSVTAYNNYGCSVSDSMVLTVQEEYTDIVQNEMGSVSVYPNPSKGNVTIGISNIMGSDRTIEVEIFSIDGRKVFSKEIANDPMNYLNTSLQPGMYQLYIKSNGELFYKDKLIIQN